MENFVQYLTKDQKKVHYRELVKDGDTYKVSLPITEDHVVSAIFIQGKRKTSTILKPVEQALCTGLMTINLIQENEYHSLNRPLEFKEDELMDFNAGVGGVEEDELSFTDIVFTASSYLDIDDRFLPSKADFFSATSWLPAVNEDGEYLQLDFGETKGVREIHVKGRGDFNQYTHSLRVSYSLNGFDFFEIDQTFVANTNNNDVVVIGLSLDARYVKIIPISWLGRPALRVAVKVVGVPSGQNIIVNYGRFTLNGRDQIDFNFTGDNFINIPMEAGLSGFIRLHKYGLYRILQFFVTFEVDFFEYGGLMVAGENLRNVNYGGQFALVFLGTSLGYLSLYINNGIATQGLVAKDHDPDRIIPAGTSFISSIILPPE